MENNVAIKVFEKEDFGEIRTADIDNKIYFCGSDVAKALGYARPADAITSHCKGVCVLPTPSAGGVQKTKFISEGDVYRLITHSKLPSAECFETWVFDEVLPTLRSEGGVNYSITYWQMWTNVIRTHNKGDEEIVKELQNRN